VFVPQSGEVVNPVGPVTVNESVQIPVVKTAVTNLLKSSLGET